MLWPAVKKFIETFIDDIEKENTEYVFDASREYLNDVEFNQLYYILSILEYKYELDQFIDPIVANICREIIKEHDGELICIEDEWRKYSMHYFGDKDAIIDEFSSFDIDIRNGKHWCEVYDY